MEHSPGYSEHRGHNRQADAEPGDAYVSQLDRTIGCCSKCVFVFFREMLCMRAPDSGSLKLGLIGLMHVAAGLGE